MFTPTDINFWFLYSDYMVSCFGLCKRITDFQHIMYGQSPKFSSFQLLEINENIRTRMI